MDEIWVHSTGHLQTCRFSVDLCPAIGGSISGAGLLDSFWLLGAGDVSGFSCWGVFGGYRWVFLKIGVPPKWMVYNEKSYWNGWFGGTPIFGNIHVDNLRNCPRRRYVLLILYIFQRCQMSHLCDCVFCIPVRLMIDGRICLKTKCKSYTVT